MSFCLCCSGDIYAANNEHLLCRLNVDAIVSLEARISVVEITHVFVLPFPVSQHPCSAISHAMF